MLFEKKKYKKKSKQRHNKGIYEYCICEVCRKNQAIETHEVFNASNRNKSIDYGAQVKICRSCHESTVIKNNLKVIWQKIIMIENNFTVDDFIKIFGRSYI